MLGFEHTGTCNLICYSNLMGEAYRCGLYTDPDASEQTKKYPIFISHTLLKTYDLIQMYIQKMLIFTL